MNIYVHIILLLYVHKFISLSLLDMHNVNKFLKWLIPYNNAHHDAR